MSLDQLNSIRGHFEMGDQIQLSAEQSRVVDHRGGHAHVVACAGAGKTEAIARRVANLIALDGAGPESIVAFTFTERAANGLKARITKRVADAKGTEFLDKLGPMFVGTIHAYCLRLLQDHVPEYGNYDVLDDNRQAGLVSREFKRLELNKLAASHWNNIAGFLRNADIIENELIDPGALDGTDFGDCYRRYTETLDRYRFLTYGQIVSKAVRALGRPEVFERVHGPLRHLIVDEYQDVNPAQEELICLLSAKPVQLCVVGDDDQAIYQWRGSDAANILEFKKRHKGATSLTLTVNRRCRPKIIKAANKFSKTIEPRHEKEMKSWRKSAGPELHAWAAHSDADEAVTIADTIEALAKRGYRYRDIAVLFRSVRTSAPLLIDELQRREIPFRCAGRTGLFLQPEASLMGQTFAWFVDADWKSSRFGESAAVDIKSLMRGYTQQFQLTKSKAADIRALLESWKANVGNTKIQVNLVRDYYRLLRELHVHDLDLGDARQAARMGTLARFSEILADYEHVFRRGRHVDEEGGKEYRGGQDRGDWVYRRLYNYLQHYSVEAYEDFSGEETFKFDAVDILTIHQAKGLEWPVVFIPALVSSRFPSSRSGKPQDWLVPRKVFGSEARERYEGSETEERRLFYVAMTRARDMLYVSRFMQKTNKFKPSPFLLDVNGADPAVQTKLPLPDPYEVPADEDPDLPTLSFSELAHYEGCPMRYRLSDSFGFQPQLATELGYGKAIHHILRRLADVTRAKKRLPTEKEVEGIFENDFYLPFANKPAFEQMLLRARKLVGKYLTTHKSDLERVWETERHFELHLESGIVNGRADVILDKEGGVIGNLALVDYKTATDPKQLDVFEFQLAIYAAAGRGEGLNVNAAYLHALDEGERKVVPVDDKATKAASARANSLIKAMARNDFPAKPDKPKCRTCDVRAVCKHAACSKYDF